MKAYSVGLEIELNLSSDEITELGIGKKLECLLNFQHPTKDERKIIPLCLNYFGGESQQVKVIQFPDNAYFGEAKKVEIIIEDPLYKMLVREGYTSDRFGLGGRVDIHKFTQSKGL